MCFPVVFLACPTIVSLRTFCTNRAACEIIFPLPSVSLLFSITFGFYLPAGFLLSRRVGFLTIPIPVPGFPAAPCLATVFVSDWKGSCQPVR